MKKLFSIFAGIAMFVVTCSVSGQITTDPAMPVAGKKVIITFDSSKESRLGKYSDDLYAHTGVIIEGKTDWQHVIGSWGNNTNQPKLTNKGNGIYELEISPDINSYYSVTGSEKVKKIAFVFRSTDGKIQTNDLFVDVFAEGLVISVSTPARQAIIGKNTLVTVAASSSQDASLSLKVGPTVIASASGKVITTGYVFTEGGWNWIIAQATTTANTVYDSVQVYVKEDVVTQTRPSGLQKGINYTSATSATLLLWAPKKEFVYVMGDFNNWQLNNAYQMKKDGDYFWLELSGLNQGKPYVFQYYIDGKIKVADPYTDQTSDPNDQYIPSASYPNLVVYPSGKADGVASVMQTGQTPYTWQVGSFTPPPREKLVIYEMLVRDFTTERTYLAVIDKLDYLKDLGINVLEMMPVNEFEGNNSWGYNPSFYFAPDKYYGPKNNLKKLVDEAHKRGMAVVIDMVLNHSYGQSPLVRMYWDSQNSRPAADNPWYNQQSNFQNPSAQWGYDLNHGSANTRQLVDSINSYWMKEYKVDGFRFDFTKGFSNTIYGPTDWGSAYDLSRIANLKRMADEIWKRNPKALVIFEHLADNSEEKELASYNIMLWGNMSGQYGEAAKGNNSDLSWGYYAARGWTLPNLVTYMESHDEERMMVKCLNSGNTEGSYNTRTLSTALDRMELSSLFLLLYPGPKMIWQFGELGYDYSINTCENPSQVSDACRLSPKPVLWSYFEQVNRKDLYKTIGRLNYLKTHYDESSSPFQYTGDLTGEVKWFRLSSATEHIVAVGNFSTSQKLPTINFPVAGTWFEYLSGNQILINPASFVMPLPPGTFRLLTTRKMTDPFAETGSNIVIERLDDWMIFPNPTAGRVTIKTDRSLGTISIRDLSGQMVFCKNFSGTNEIEINLDTLSPGIYLVQSGNRVEKLIKY
jgi:1,4-alpha-glucan branching enzyme